MKQKHKRFLTRVLALGMTLCMSVQMLPVQVFAAEAEEQRLLNELEEQQETIEQLKKELEDELGMSLEDAYAEAGISTEGEDMTMMMATAAASADEVVTEDLVVEGVTYGTFTFNKTTQTITKFAQASTAPKDYTLTIPAEIDGVKVLGIGSGNANTAAVSANKAIRIVLPEGLETIGAGAFRSCSSVTEFDLPSTVTSIEASAFYSCSKLTGIDIPDSVTSIGDSAFYYCFGLTSVTLPEGLNIIEANAFRNCSALVSITLPEGLETIGYGAFCSCSKLTSVDIPESVTLIDGYAFYGCSALNSLDLPSGLEAIGQNAFSSSGLTSIAIPASVTSIGDNAFQTCASLEAVTFAENSKLSSIGMQAFASCTALKSISLPASITSLGTYTFQKCTALETADLSALTVTSLPNYFMDGCTSLANLTLPATLAEIGLYCFQKCSALESVSLPAGLTGIGSSAFNGAGLKSITLPDGLNTIGASAFDSCKALESVNFPTSITSLGSWAFMGCTSLTAADLSSLTVTEIPTEFMSGCTALASLKLPPALKTVKVEAFYNCEALKSVSFPATLTTVQTSAFENVPLTSLTFTDGERSILYIYKKAFKNSKLTALELPDIGSGYYQLMAEAFGGETLTKLTVGRHAYANDRADIDTTNSGSSRPDLKAYTGPFNGQPLHDVTLPADCTLVPKGMFGTSALDNLDFLHSRVTVVDDYAFYGCDALDQADFNALLPRLTAVEDFAFANCDGLTNLPTMSGITEMGAYAFARCSNLVSVADQSTWEVIGGAAFYDCTKLRTLGAMQPTTLNDYAFYDCTSLQATPDMTLVHEIRDKAFSNCDSLTEIRFYDALWYMGDSIVERCDNLTTVTFVNTDNFVCYSSGGGYNPIPNKKPFKGNTSIRPENITISPYMTRLPDLMFAEAAFLTDLTFLPDTVTAYGNRCFEESSLVSVVIPAHITEVGMDAFSAYSSQNGKLQHLEILCSADAFRYDTDEASRYYGTFAGQPFQSRADDQDKTDIILPDDWTEIPFRLFDSSHITDIDFLNEMDSLTAIGPRAFETCYYLTSLNLPTRNDLTIYGRAFYESLGNIEHLTIPASVKVLEDYQEASGSSYHMQFYSSGTYVKHVTVLNPELDLQQELFAQGDSCRVFNYRDYSATDKLTFHGTEGSTAALLVAAETAFTNLAGSEHYRFAPLKGAETITVTVTADGRDVTGQCTVSWYDSSGWHRGTGSTITPHMAGDTYRYVITLDNSLAAVYYAPDEGIVLTSDTDPQTVSVTLELIGETTFTGRAVDEDGDPIPGATVTLSQSVNGIDLPDTVVTTDENGVFTAADAKDVYTEAVVSITGRYYGNFIQMVPSGKEITDLGTVTMAELPTLTYPINVSVRMADGRRQVITDLSAFTFEVVDAGSSEYYGQNLSFSMQGCLLILEEPDKDYLLRSGYPLVLKVTVNEEKLGMVLPDDQRAIEFTTGQDSVSITLLEKGRFTVEPDVYSGEGQYVWVYGEDGKLCDSYELDGGRMESMSMDSGTYTAVIIDRTVPLYNPTDLSLLTDTLKMKAGKHFWQQQFTVRDGEITSLTGFTVPTLDTEATESLFRDMFKTAKISRTVTAPVIGQEYYLIFEYELKDEYKTDGEKTFTFSLPAGTDFNSIATPYGTDTYSPSVSPNVTSLTVTTTANAGRVHLAVQSVKVNWSSAFSVIVTSGSQVSTPVSGTYAVRDLDIFLGSGRINRIYNRSVTITAIPGSTVHLYIDGEEATYLDGDGNPLPAGYAPVANQAGTVEVTIDYPTPVYEGRTWRLTADSTKGDTFVESYETETVTFVPDPFNPVITANVVETPEDWDEEKTAYWNKRWGQNVVIRVNDYEQPAQYINTTYGPNIWEVRFAEGSGKYIEGNTVWLTCGFVNDSRGAFTAGYKVGDRFDVPLYRVSEDPEDPDYDLFRGVGPVETEYAGVAYDTTAEYQEMVASRIPTVSQEDVDARNAELAEITAMDLTAQGLKEAYPDLAADGVFDGLDADLTGSLIDPSFAARVDALMSQSGGSIRDTEEFAALSEEEQLEALETEREIRLLLEQADQTLREAAEVLMPGKDVDWSKTGADLMAELGYTETTIRNRAELEDILSQKEFDTLQLGNTLIYQHSSDSETVTISVDLITGAMTMSTMDVSGTVRTLQQQLLSSIGPTVQSSGNGRDKDSVVAKILPSPDQVESLVSDANTGISSLDTSLDIAIKGVENALKKISDNPGLWKAAGAFGQAGLSAKLSALTMLKTVVSKIAMVLSVGAVGLLVVETFKNFNDHQRALAYLEKVKADDKYSYECAVAARNLADAYADLGLMLMGKALGQLGNILIMISLGAGVLASGGATAIAMAVTTILGMLVDLAYDSFINTQKERIKSYEQKRREQCEGSRGSDDGAPTDVVNDPSGYVYEAVFSNRVEGAIATTYYEGKDGAPVLWDAEKYNQSNPLITNGSGFYRWDVPRGNWMVTVEKDGYETADTREIYAELGTLGADDEGWLPVLPVQTEVHIPLESTQAPTVENAIAYEDGISLQFSQYMKEESLTFTVTDANGTYSGGELELVWLDQELSDHYYGRTFASELVISRADGEYWKGTATVSIADGGVNYVDTALGARELSLTVLPAPAGFDAEEEITVAYGRDKTVTVTVTDRNGKAVQGTRVDAAVQGLAKLADGASAWGETDKNGTVTFTLSGYCVGEDTLTLSLSGRAEQKEIPVTVKRIAVPDEPVVTINGVDYTGQGHEVEVVEGTVITVTGTNSADTLYYSIGAESCPCESEQILIENGQLTVTESGYYKFAAERNGEYSSRVHISITVTYVNTVDEDMENGTLSVSPSGPVREGSEVTVTSHPVSDYYTTRSVSAAMADGSIVDVTQTDENTFTFVQPAGSVTVSAVFGLKSEQTYSVTVIQPEEGAVITVSPAGTHAPGTLISYRIDVEPGYELWDVNITDSEGNYVSFDGWASGTFEMPAGGATISADVGQIIYQIWTWGGMYDEEEEEYIREGGEVSVSNENPVYGETVTVTVTPDEDYSLYYLDIWYYDGNGAYQAVDYTYVGEDGGSIIYTFVQPECHNYYDVLYVDAYFAPSSEDSLTVVQPANGSITVKPQQPKVGDTVTVKVIPDEGFEFGSLSVTGGSGEIPIELLEEKDGVYIYTYTQPEGMVTISAVIGSGSGSGDTPTVTLSGGTLTVIHPTAGADDIVDMVIIVAGYTGGQMVSCQVIDRVTGVTEAELTVTGETVRVFFLDPDTYAPLFAYAGVAQTN